MSQTSQNASPSGRQFLGPIASIAEAVTWAKSVGITHADYDGDLRVARIVTAALKDIQRTNLPLPSVVQVNREAFLSEFGEEGIAAPAGSIGSILLLNPDSSYWNTPDDDAQYAFEESYWSTNHPLHAIYHEAGHFSHYQQGNDPVARWRRRRFNANNEHIASRVSRYAKTNYAECIAEIAAQLLAGGSIEPDILAWYRKQGGIVP